MDPAKLIRSNDLCSQKPPTTGKTALDALKSASNAIVQKLLRVAPQDECAGNTVDLDGINEVEGVTLLAKGGYNMVWLVKLDDCYEITVDVEDKNDSLLPKQYFVDRFILRVPCDNTLLPYQVTNEVASRKFVAAKLPHIPVPKIFFYHATSLPGQSFIVEEYIDGPPLSTIWMTLTLPQKEIFADTLSTITLDLAETRFNFIGGLNINGLTPAPTVEGCKLFKRRDKFHSEDFYPIGPYKSTKEYILACYEREICYYTHAPEHDIDEDLFRETSVQDFIVELQKKRDSIARIDMTDEPFSLVHGDLHGRNILTKNGEISAFIDWEFAGSYPLSETLTDGGIDVVEPNSMELDEENLIWNIKICNLIRRKAKERLWPQNEVDLLMGDGNPELGIARSEMFP
ncbi:hypothetical protein N7456_012456 [Penicillium angulare]|uniref:Aminoglycoside phosphotransferase domain-containing protein n=1 Tax=Penicillium angulare TaxID=116970 RepID=A0A9W9EVV7_9EURO|nr:hypothetical protein N7456_012456 [Penicillium angulare]